MSLKQGLGKRQGMRLFSLPDFKGFGQSLKIDFNLFFRDPPLHICYLGFRYVVLLTKHLFCFPRKINCD